VRPSDLLQPTAIGLYCPPADIFIDPVGPVRKALISHAHSDHAHSGHGSVLATEETIAIMKIRMGDACADHFQSISFGETIQINGIDFSFHPAGHVLGSAQIAVSTKQQKIVVSGDYKRETDPTCPSFEPVQCDVFVTEATFGLPVFRHPPASHEIQRLLKSVSMFPERPHLVGVYSLGKAQRILALLRAAGYGEPVYLHGALEKVTTYYKDKGIKLGAVLPVAGRELSHLKGAVILCPPGSLNDRWSRRFIDPVTACASGWMRIRARAKQRGVELPLVISDHADWTDLQHTIKETEASDIWVTHGQEDALVHWCNSLGRSASPLRLVGYDEEADGTIEHQGLMP
jgi:putative mRNA 3-end processing factor